MADEPTIEPVVKAKRQLTDIQLAQLATAREKALLVRREQHAARLAAKAEALKPAPVEEVEEPLPPAPKKPKKPKADPVVVVEQASDDSDDFDAPPGVVFVRRKKARAAAPAPREMSEEERYTDDLYHRMVTGNFRY